MTTRRAPSEALSQAIALLAESRAELEEMVLEERARARRARLEREVDALKRRVDALERRLLGPPVA